MKSMYSEDIAHLPVVDVCMRKSVYRNSEKPVCEQNHRQRQANGQLFSRMEQDLSEK